MVGAVGRWWVGEEKDLAPIRKTLGCGGVDEKGWNDEQMLRYQFVWQRGDGRRWAIQTMPVVVVEGLATVLESMTFLSSHPTCLTLCASAIEP